MDQVNLALRHQNPQVRKEAERLFKSLYSDYGQKLEAMLVNQKPQLLQKILGQAQKEFAEANPNKPGAQNASKAGPNAAQESKVDDGVQRA